MAFQKECIFCEIVKGTSHAHIVYESRSHLAFLSIFPISPAVTVVIPKKHCSGDVLSLQNLDYIKLLKCAKVVAQALKIGLKAERVAMVAEGMMINHAHIKLFPLIIGAASPEYGASIPGDFHIDYPGYLTTLEGPRCTNQQLSEWQAQIIEVGGAQSSNVKP